jgi:formate dehydrogenase maturation protein FdhE
VATIHDEVKETIRVHLTLVHVFHVYASADTPWVAHALSNYTFVRYGRIASVSVAHDATHFRDSICPICVSIVQMLVHQGSTNAGLNRHRWGLPP